MIDARQANPIDTSSPDAVISPLWQATQLSADWKMASLAAGPACPGGSAARGAAADQSDASQTTSAVAIAMPERDLAPAVEDAAIEPVPEQVGEKRIAAL